MIRPRLTSRVLRGLQTMIATRPGDQPHLWPSRDRDVRTAVAWISRIATWSQDRRARSTDRAVVLPPVVTVQGHDLRACCRTLRGIVVAPKLETDLSYHAGPRYWYACPACRRNQAPRESISEAIILWNRSMIERATAQDARRGRRSPRGSGPGPDVRKK